MLNTNYTYVNPIVHQHTDNLAKGVPHHTVNRNISQPVENTKILAHIIEKMQNFKKKLYSPKLSQVRFLLNPI